MNYSINKNKVKLLMLDGNLTQQDLAKEIGMSIKTINKMFANNSVVTTKTINKLAKVFGVKPSELVVHE